NAIEPSFTGEVTQRTRLRPFARATAKEALVQLAREPAATAVGTDADEVDVRLVRKALREETVEEGYELAVLLRDEARLPKVLEEEPREERAHRASVPPVVDERGNPVVV